MKSAGKSAAQFSAHCFHTGQGGAFRGAPNLAPLPLGDASSALKATTITQGGGMLSILLFSANPLWEPAPSGRFGGGIYRGHGINTDPTH